MKIGIGTTIGKLISNTIGIGTAIVKMISNTIGIGIGIGVKILVLIISGSETCISKICVGTCQRTIQDSVPTHCARS